jgi:hypothetical protein
MLGLGGGGVPRCAVLSSQAGHWPVTLLSSFRLLRRHCVVLTSHCVAHSCLQHGHYTNKHEGMQAVRQFVPPNTLRCGDDGGFVCRSCWHRICVLPFEQPSALVGLSALPPLATYPQPRSSCTLSFLTFLTFHHTGWCTTVALCEAFPQWAPPCGRACRACLGASPLARLAR